MTVQTSWNFSGISNDNIKIWKCILNNFWPLIEVFLFFFDWDLLHSKLNSYCKAWYYRKRKENRRKAYRTGYNKSKDNESIISLYMGRVALWIKVLHWDWKVSGSNSPMYVAGFVGPVSLWGSRYSLGWNKIKTQWLTFIYWSCPIDSGPSWLWGSQVAGKKFQSWSQFRLLGKWKYFAMKIYILFARLFCLRIPSF